MNPEQQSAPEAVASKIEVEKREVPVSFLFVDHSFENGAEITRQIAQSDADIILEELVGSSTEMRTKVEAIINSGINAEDVHERASITRDLSQSLKDLVWALAGSGKSVHFIDVANDMPEYELVKRARAMRQQDSLQYEQLFAQSNAAREAVVKWQINDYREAYPDSKILAVLGAVHSTIAPEFGEQTEVAYLEPTLEARAAARRAHSN